MSLRNVLLLVVLAVLVTFVVVNWAAFSVPTSLSLVFASVEAPLGLIMLGITACLAALFLAYVVYLQSSVILEARRHAREFAAQRELADQAEASRFTELRRYLDERLDALAADVASSRERVEGAFTETGAGVRASIEQSANTLAAHLGELEDRLERRLPAGTRT